MRLWVTCRRGPRISTCGWCGTSPWWRSTGTSAEPRPSYAEPREALLGHRVDAVVTRMPVGAGGLHVTVLYDEPRELLIPRDHRLAGKESVTLDDIADEPMPGCPTRPGTPTGGSTPGPAGRRRPAAPWSTTSRTSSS
jgi:DNA-binding transcriptional LysR family regulator